MANNNPLDIGILGSAGLAGLSALSGILGGSTSGTSSTTPTLDPKLQPLQDTLLQKLLERIGNPSAAIDPLRTTARENVNRNYEGVNDRILATLSGRGFANSGSLPSSVAKADLSRRGDLSDLEGQLASLTLQDQNTASSLAERLLGQGRGSTTNTQTTVGTDASRGLNAGLSTLTTLLALNRLLGQGGDGGGGGVDQNPNGAGGGGIDWGGLFGGSGGGGWGFPGSRNWELGF